MKISFKWPIGIASLLMIISGCQWQEEWLDVKRNINDVMPSTLEDCQAILDEDLTMNRQYPMLAMTCTDNLYIPKEIVNSISEFERNSYTFAHDIFGVLSHGDYFNQYVKIEYANIALERLGKIDPSHPGHGQIKGQALFFRAFAHYCLAEVYGSIYNKATAATDQGIQLRLTADPNITTPRSSVSETYGQIISDLNEAVTLLPEKPAYLTRPSKAAAYALLAKTYLSIDDYARAAEFAGKSLGIQGNLLDFNSEVIKPASTYVFPDTRTGLNPEIILYAVNFAYSSLRPATSIQFADSTLYRSYVDNDLRKSLFYREDAQGRARFTGVYSGNLYNFGGLAVNETLLILAECKSRLGQWQEGMEALNRLLGYRFRKETFQPLEAAGQAEALTLILEERRKELPFTGIVRWQDLRRLNKEPERAVKVTHISSQGMHELLPGDRKYVFPLPVNEIALSGVAQNPR